MAEKLLTIREASHYLNVTEKEIITFAEEGKIPAYKVGGVYLRFKKDQLDRAKAMVAEIQGVRPDEFQASFVQKARDFFYFYDFYILSAVLIAVTIFFIIQG